MADADGRIADAALLLGRGEELRLAPPVQAGPFPVFTSLPRPGGRLFTVVSIFTSFSAVRMGP
mgnify:CR=1 FL=1